MGVSDMRFDHAQHVQGVTPDMYRRRAVEFLAKPSTWTAAMDLRMFEALGRGDGVDVIGAKMVLAPSDVTRRYRAWRDHLTDYSRDYIPLAAQSVVFEVLREAAPVLMFRSRRVH